MYVCIYTGGSRRSGGDNLYVVQGWDNKIFTTYIVLLDMNNTISKFVEGYVVGGSRRSGGDNLYVVQGQEHGILTTYKAKLNLYKRNLYVRHSQKRRRHTRYMTTVRCFMDTYTHKSINIYIYIYVYDTAIYTVYNTQSGCSWIARREDRHRDGTWYSNTCPARVVV